MLPSLLLGSMLALGQSPVSSWPDPALETTPLGLLLESETSGLPQASSEIPTLKIQLPGVTPQAAPTPPTTTTLALIPPEDTGLFMRFLQGTWYGAVLDDNRLSVSGWTEASFTASSATRNQLPLGFNDLANNFLLQQNWLRLERSVEPTATTPTWGFLVDAILPGSDYRFTLAKGLLDNQLTANHGSPSQYGIDPVQFYTELYLPDVGRGLDIKLGRFFALFGVESIDTVLNPFVSRSYTFLYDPFTHTGLVTTLKLSEEWSIDNGLVTGSDVFIDRAANPTYIGGIKWAPTDNHASALLEVIVGDGRYNPGQSFNNPEIFDLVLTRKLSARLTWSAEGLYGFTTNVPNIGFANWCGVVNYLSYEFDPKWLANGRLEFFDDPQGQRTGYKGVYEAITTGITYKPFPALWFRPEIRFDHNDASPFEGKSCLLTMAFDCIIRW